MEIERDTTLNWKKGDPQFSNYGGDFPPLPIVIPGTITALLVLPPLKRGIAIEKRSFPNAYPPLLFLLILALEITIYSIQFNNFISENRLDRLFKH